MIDIFQMAGEDHSVFENLHLIDETGSAGYHSPISTGLSGGGRFTCAAAMVIDILKTTKGHS